MKLNLTLSYLPTSEEMVHSQQRLPAGFAAAHGLARLTFTQRTIEAPLLPHNQRLWRNNVLKSVETVGRVIVAKRKQFGLTQRQLAQKAAIPRKMLGRWERNRSVPTSAEWRTLAEILNLPEASNHWHMSQRSRSK
jgi:DNA-binding transcriptional regulator YiaG